MKDDLWSKYSGKDDGIDNLLTVMGFNPNVDYSQKKKVCSKCGEKEVVVKERHADTDMNCMVEVCLACGHEIEV